MSEPIIELRSLGKRYGERDALLDVDLEVSPGTCLAIFGPNGSGKTTLLKLIATLMRPTSGELRVAGLPLPRRAREVREKLGVVLDRPLLPPDFSLEEGLVYQADLAGTRVSTGRRHEILQRVGLRRRRHDPLRTYSRGMAQRASLACALLVEPEILLLDEPYTGLDPQGCALVDSIIEEYRERGRTVLLVTHEIARGIARADRVAVLRRARLVRELAAAEAELDEVLGVLQ